ncbi:MAG: hypothetical protein M1826_000877 [Phylliscum demangeonii]|nr:MAG: hypothetical protein M1826_000877 [Phylliscum demangeonii]
MTLLPPSAPPLRTIYVLDSSFNPPTRAHLHMAASALLSDRYRDREGHDGRQRQRRERRLILLLATQNADKAPKPAPFEHRLAMMVRLAHDLRAHLASHTAVTTTTTATTTATDNITIDIAITRHPYFHDKAPAIAHALASSAPTEHVYLIGFDTLIRILNPAYYPPPAGASSSAAYRPLAPVEALLGAHRLRVTYRGGSSARPSPAGTHAGESSRKTRKAERAAQDAYVEDVRAGGREAEGGRREWADRIELVVDGEDDEDEMVGVSSTRAREAVRVGDEAWLARMVPDRVRGWIRQEGLYVEEKEKKKEEEEEGEGEGADGGADGI